MPDPFCLFEKDIRRREDGTSCVRCDGKDFEILTDKEAPSDSESGRPQREVQWKDEWRIPEELEKAGGAIEEYEKLLRQHQQLGIATPSDCGSLPSAEPTDPAAERGATNLMSRGSGTPSESNVQWRIQPAKGLDYSQWLRCVLLRPLESRSGQAGASIKQMLATIPVRPILVRDKFVDDGRVLDFERSAKRRASILQDSGYEQLAECDRCQQGWGPFTKCVVGDVFMGACANCVHAGAGVKCNFYNGPVLPVTRKIPVRRHHISLGTPIVSSPTTSSTSCESPGSENDRSSIEAEKQFRASSIPTSPLPTRSPLSSSAYWRQPVPPELGSSPFSPAQPVERISRADQGIIDANSYPGPALKSLSTSLQNARSLNTSRAHTFENTRMDDTSCSDYIRKKQGSFPVKTCPAYPGGADFDENPDLLWSRGTKRKFSSASTFVRHGLLASTRRHSGCKGGSVACTSPSVNYTVTAHPHASRIPGTVYSDQHFDESKASNAEVRFIISRCDCARAERFEDGWQFWLYICRRERKANKHTKESYISTALLDELNEAIGSRCPKRLDRYVTKSGRKDDPIVIDEGNLAEGGDNRKH